MAQPVAFWEAGRVIRQVDAAAASTHGAVILDLGEEWTPYIFTERGNRAEEPVKNTYRSTYLALARGEYPKSIHGDRARQDKYLELYGIMPTLKVLRERFKEVRQLPCKDTLNVEPLKAFQGFIAYRGNPKARKDSRQFEILEAAVAEMVRKAKVTSPEELDVAHLSDADQSRLRQYARMKPEVEVVRAAQQRLVCEGFLRSRAKYTPGAIDWITHEALAEFERRHRVYGWGYIGRDTLEVLQAPPLDLERESVIRVLTERAIHAFGVLEDGSTSTKGDGSPRTFKGADGKQHLIPNLEAQLREHVISAFGLQTNESTGKWLEGLGDLSPAGERLVAIKGVDLPEYYDGNMELSVVIDRGDVWYDFPYDEKGNEIPQPVRRRPHITVFARYLNQDIPLARYGTTIGGWRSEFIDGHVLWRYKGSPTGPRVWTQIVAAPVWIPPESTPPKDLLKRVPGKQGKDKYEVNYHEVGPSYASAYGLVAAYHYKYGTNSRGEIVIGGDEGIRTHGSVDYMSIMRRFSHGCHRLHNHIAVRLMSFVLAHRPHRRMGQDRAVIDRLLDHEGFQYELAIREGGYVFQLERPIPVNVTEGRIQGTRKTPIAFAVPKFNSDAGAYVTPDGGAVQLRNGQLVDVPVPVAADAGTTPAAPAGGGLWSLPPR